MISSRLCYTRTTGEMYVTGVKLKNLKKFSVLYRKLRDIRRYTKLSYSSGQERGFIFIFEQERNVLWCYCAPQRFVHNSHTLIRNEGKKK